MAQAPNAPEGFRFTPGNFIKLIHGFFNSAFVYSLKSPALVTGLNTRFLKRQKMRLVIYERIYNTLMQRFSRLDVYRYSIRQNMQHLSIKKV